MNIDSEAKVSTNPFWRYVMYKASVEDSDPNQCWSPKPDPSILMATRSDLEFDMDTDQSKP